MNDAAVIKCVCVCPLDHAPVKESTRGTLFDVKSTCVGERIPGYAHRTVDSPQDAAQGTIVIEQGGTTHAASPLGVNI